LTDSVPGPQFTTCSSTGSGVGSATCSSTGSGVGSATCSSTGSGSTIASGVGVTLTGVSAEIKLKILVILL
jgi:hypothetical protein